MQHPTTYGKRIICTVTNDLTYDQRMIRICGSLAAMGHDVLLVGRRLPRSVALNDYAFRQKRLWCFFRKGKLFYLEYNLRLFIFLLTQKVDTINSVDLDTILPGLLVARLRGKRLVYDAHEYFTETPEVVRRPGVQKVWEWVARQCIPRATGAYTVGPALAQIMSERYGITFGCIRNLPYGKNSQGKPEKEKPPVILYQGTLNEGRGLEAMIAAMQHLDHAQLWLAGEGDLSSFLRKLTLNLNVQDKVRFLGFVRPQALAELTPRATLGINLLDNNGLSYYYSLANKAFDYLQAGVPALHMDFPEYRTLHEQYGGILLLNDLSPTRLAQVIQHYLDNKNLRDQLVAETRQAARELTWESEAVLLQDYYA